MTQRDFRTAAAARYRRGAPQHDGAWNEMLSLLFAHRSVRAFLPDPVPDAVLTALVGAAQSASTSSNVQCWSVVAVRDPARKAALAKIAGGQRHVADCPLFLVWLVDLSRLRRLHRAAGATGEGLDYFESFLVGAVDTALAAQNAVVAMEALGYAGVYIGALRNDPEAVAGLLDLPPETFALFGLCAGVADPASAAAVKPRLPQAVVLHEETYRDRLTSQALRAYDEDLAEFQREQGMTPQGWSALARARTTDAASLKGRERLADILRARGFGLR